VVLGTLRENIHSELNVTSRSSGTTPVALKSQSKLLSAAEAICELSCSPSWNVVAPNQCSRRPAVRWDRKAFRK
jgi:hypothetical protein